MKNIQVNIGFGVRLFFVEWILFSTTLSNRLKKIILVPLF